MLYLVTSYVASYFIIVPMLYKIAINIASYIVNKKHFSLQEPVLFLANLASNFTKSTVATICKVVFSFECIIDVSIDTANCLTILLGWKSC